MSECAQPPAEKNYIRPSKLNPSKAMSVGNPGDPNSDPIVLDVDDTATEEDEFADPTGYTDGGDEDGCDGGDDDDDDDDDDSTMDGAGMDFEEGGGNPVRGEKEKKKKKNNSCLLYTSPSPRD